MNRTTAIRVEGEARRVRDLLMTLQPSLEARGLDSIVYRLRQGDELLPIIGLAFEVVGTLADAAAVIVATTALAEERGLLLRASIDDLSAPHVVEVKGCSVFATIETESLSDLSSVALAVNTVEEPRRDY